MALYQQVNDGNGILTFKLDDSHEIRLVGLKTAKMTDLSNYATAFSVIKIAETRGSLSDCVGSEVRNSLSR